MIIGTVGWFNRKRGLGFIAPDEGDKDAFVHISAVKRAGSWPEMKVSSWNTILLRWITTYA